MGATLFGITELYMYNKTRGGRSIDKEEFGGGLQLYISCFPEISLNDIEQYLAIYRETVQVKVLVYKNA